MIVKEILYYMFHDEIIEIRNIFDFNTIYKGEVIKTIEDALMLEVAYIARIDDHIVLYVD